MSFIDKRPMIQPRDALVGLFFQMASLAGAQSTPLFCRKLGVEQIRVSYLQLHYSYEAQTCLVNLHITGFFLFTAGMYPIYTPMKPALPTLRRTSNFVYVNAKTMLCTICHYNPTRAPIPLPIYQTDSFQFPKRTSTLARASNFKLPPNAFRTAS